MISFPSGKALPELRIRLANPPRGLQDGYQRAAAPALQGRPSFCAEEAEAVGQATSPAIGRGYGLARVCRTWDLTRSTVYLRRQQRAIPVEPRPAPLKRGQLGPCSDEELVGHIRRVLAESPFHGEGYRKVWARLRYQGIRTSKERVRRLMQAHGLQPPHRVGWPHGPKAHDGTITTERPDQMWGTDATTTVTTEEGQVFVFVAVDHCTGECIGLHAAKSGNRFEAMEPLRQGVRDHFGGFDRGVAAGLAIRHDHDSA